MHLYNCCYHLCRHLWTTFLWLFVPVVVSDELVLLCGCVGRCWGVPSVLDDVGVRFDEHTELQIFSLIHLDRKALLGQFRGQLGQQPDVGLIWKRNPNSLFSVANTNPKPHPYPNSSLNPNSSLKPIHNLTPNLVWDTAQVTDLQPAGMSLNCSPLLHLCQCRKCFLCLQAPQPRWSGCSLCQGGSLRWSEPSPLLSLSEDKKKRWKLSSNYYRYRNQAKLPKCLALTDLVVYFQVTL